MLVHSHAGDGLIRIKLDDDRGERGEGRGERGDEKAISPNLKSQISNTFAILSQLRPLVSEVGGKMIVRRPIDGVALSPAEIWGDPGPEVRIMQAIRERFDPKKILNPGRFVY
jgi:hypothetical protein